MKKPDRINFRLGPDLRQVLQAYTEHEDRSEAATIRQAVWLFLESERVSAAGKERAQEAIAST